MRSIVLVAVAVGLAAGCNHGFDPPSPPATPPLTSPQSFTVQGTLNSDVSSNEQDLVVRVDPVTQTMIVGTPGTAVSVPIVSSDGITFSARTSVVLPVPGWTCGSTATYSDFHFVAGSDSISGSATGVANLFFGDYGMPKKAQLDFRGPADVTPPSIVGGGSPVDPLAEPSFKVSEPLPLSAQAQLVSATDRIALVSYSNGAPTTVGFEMTGGALRYDTTYNLVIDGWADLAGNPGAPPDAITTSPSPVLIAADGFESASDTLGGATIVDATVLPPISGQKSALLGPLMPTYPSCARFTVRLSVAPGNSVVRFSLRRVGSPRSGDEFNTQVRLAAPGGQIATVPLANLGTASTEQVLPSGVLINMGDVIPIEAPLPNGVGDEVVFDFQVGNYNIASCSPPLATPTFELDDLRVE